MTSFRMRTNALRAFVPVAAIVIACAAPTASEAATLHCGSITTPRNVQVTHSLFTASVLTGPDSALSLRGRLGYAVNGSGLISGELIPSTRRSVAVTGSVTGRDFHLRMRLASGVISGVGRASHTIRSCKDIPSVGTLTGPRPGDTGRWGISDTISGTVDKLNKYCMDHPFTCAVVIGIILS